MRNVGGLQITTKQVCVVRLVIYDDDGSLRVAERRGPGRLLHERWIDTIRERVKASREITGAASALDRSVGPEFQLFRVTATTVATQFLLEVAPQDRIIVRTR